MGGRFGRGGGGGVFGGLFDDGSLGPDPAPITSKRPPKVWGTLAIEGEELVCRLNGWRAVVAITRTVSVPLESIVRAERDPAARNHIRAKLRRRSGTSGLFRVGPYHSLEGWSFWSIGLGQNAVVVECTGVRWRHIVVEVADPERTVAEIRQVMTKPSQVSFLHGSNPERKEP
jgi:hypothetical protein